MNRKINKGIFIFCSVVILTSSFTMALAEDGVLKEQILQSAYKNLLNKEAGLGRYTAIMTKSGTVELGRPIRTLTCYQIYYNGFKKTGEKFLEGEVNGLLISEERLKELKIGKTRESVTGPRFLSDSFQESIVNFFYDDYKSFCTLEGTEVANNIDTYKLKFTPLGNEKIGEAYFFIDKSSYEIVKAIINGKPDDKDIDSVITINYSKSFGNYFMPDSIQLEAFGPIQLEGQNNSYQYRGEIIFSDYRSY